MVAFNSASYSAEKIVGREGSYFALCATRALIVSGGWRRTGAKTAEERFYAAGATDACRMKRERGGVHAPAAALEGLPPRNDAGDSRR